MRSIIEAYNRIKNNKFLYIFLSLLVLLAISLFINFYSLKVFDPDGYYHIRHAWLYRTNGITDTSFPWVQYSVINKLGGDLWYGFHIFLIPFTYFQDFVWAIKITSVVITWVALSLYFFAVHRLKFRLPLLWPAVLPFMSYYLLARLMVTRPHPLSLGLNMLLFSFLIQGGTWPVFIIGFFLSFIHLNLAWVPVLTLLIVSIGRKINRQSLEINKALALVGGIVIGIFLKPNPIAALKLNYTQLVDIILIKMRGIRLDFGNELKPIELSNFSFYHLPFVAAVTLFFVWLVYKRHLAKISLMSKIAMWTLLLLIMLFLGLVLFVAGRAMDFYISYLIMLTGFCLTFSINGIADKFRKSGLDNSLKQDVLKGGVILAALFFIVFYNIFSTNDFRSYLDGLPDPQRSERSAAWLHENTEKNEIVFHLGWDHFPELFFWNQHNYYINGMDPIFMYKYDTKLYWEFYFLSIDQGGEYTCSHRKCTKDEAVKTYDVLIDDFNASYILIRPSSHPNVFSYLISSPDKFEIVFINQPDVIFRIKPPKKI